MKQTVSIWMCILILVLWPKPAVAVVDKPQLSHSIIQESGPIHQYENLIRTFAVNNDDSQEIPALVEAFQDEEPLYVETAVLELFTLKSNDLANPLLIDRPPPSPGA